jgi:chromosome partitioning protein
LLALGLQEQGRRVAMIDSDPNRPLMNWAAMPGRPEGVSVHPAPTPQDVRDAWREAQRKQPDWVILDTEGSLRGAMAFTELRIDMVLTPLAASQLEADQAIRAAALVGQFGGRAGGRVIHRCLLTRVPAALRPRSIKQVVEQLRERDVELLPTALIEKEAFRTLFMIGGGFEALEASGVSGIPSARQNARTYLEAVQETLLKGPAAAA